MPALEVSSTLTIAFSPGDEQYRYSGGSFGYEYPNPGGACTEAPAPAPSLTESDVSDQFVGCFRDVKGSRTMVRGYTSTTNMSNKVWFRNQIIARKLVVCGDARCCVARSSSAALPRVTDNVAPYTLLVIEWGAIHLMLA